ncbi:hypothetical protein ACIBO9_32205 [Streptomyces prunicolor]|uniref:hypothetical protein n=1 Tax=Streptomyces prunicolor TaxID=67348 RepID=UPI0037CDED7C
MSKLVRCTTVVHTLRSRISPTGPVRLSGGPASTPSIPRDMADSSVLLVENPSANGVSLSLNGGLA